MEYSSEFTRIGVKTSRSHFLEGSTPEIFDMY